MDDVLGYTLSQVRAFSQAIRRCEAAEQAQWLSLIALATRGEPRQLDRTLERLCGGWKSGD